MKEYSPDKVYNCIKYSEVLTNQVDSVLVNLIGNFVQVSQEYHLYWKLSITQMSFSIVSK